MEQIDFHFGVANRTVYVAKLIKKVQKMGLSVAVWGRDDILMKRAYDDLWRFEDLTFIAHCWVWGMRTKWTARCTSERIWRSCRQATCWYSWTKKCPRIGRTP